MNPRISTRSGIWALMIVLLHIQIPPEVDAQGEDHRTAGNLTEFILVKVVPGKRREFIEFIEAEYLPLQLEDQNIKQIKYFVEDIGLEWDLIVMLSYDGYAKVEQSRDRFAELLEEKIPDEAARSAFVSRFQGYVDRHKHMFYRAVPALSR